MDKRVDQGSVEDLAPGERGGSTTQVDQDVEKFIAETKYVVRVQIYAGDDSMIGRLERTWGGNTIGELCATLISTCNDRDDLDQCWLEVRWRKQ